MINVSAFKDTQISRISISPKTCIPKDCLTQTPWEEQREFDSGRQTPNSIPQPRLQVVAGHMQAFYLSAFLPVSIFFSTFSSTNGLVMKNSVRCFSSCKAADAGCSLTKTFSSSVGCTFSCSFLNHWLHSKTSQSKPCCGLSTTWNSSVMINYMLNNWAFGSSLIPCSDCSSKTAISLSKNSVLCSTASICCSDCKTSIYLSSLATSTVWTSISSKICCWYAFTFIANAIISFIWA